MLRLATPLQFNGASPIPPFTVVGAGKETSPVGVPEPEVTVADSVTDAPCVIGAGVVLPLTVVLVVVALKVPTAAPQPSCRFEIFTVPRPVAKSYPAVVVKAGVLVAPIVVKRTPFVPAVVLLQFKELGAQGTELLPFVMSLKTHPAGGGCVGSVRRLELHDLLAAVCAIL